MWWKDLLRANPAPKRGWSLAGRLTAWYTLAALLLISCTAGILYWALTSNMSRENDLFLADKVHVLRAILRDRPNDYSALREEVELESAARRYERFYVRLIDENGRQRLSTPGMDGLLAPGLFPPVISADAEPGGHGAAIRSLNGSQFFAVAARAAIGHSDHSWIAQIAVDRNRDQALLGAYRQWLWLVLGVAVVICPLIAYRIATQGLRPVQEITKTAERTGSQNLKTRIDPAGYPVELAALAQKFNAMLDRLDEAFGRLSRFSADIAHELRTPVNNIRGEAEVSLRKGRSLEEYRDALGSCLEESTRLSELIESLLFLARAESPGRHLVREPVQVVKELEAVRDYYEPVAADSGVALSVTASDEIEANLDRVLFQRAIANLVENAVSHTPAGGNVSLAAHADDGVVCINISDTGEGIPPQHLSHVFDRFYRADSARSSRGGHMGLGLAIVQAIVELHGGSIDISSELSRGTRVSMALPLTHSPDGKCPK